MQIKKVNPLEDKILVRVMDEAEEQTSTGIVLPETVKKEKPILGEVKAVGDSDMIKVKVGDKVIFGKFSGTEFQINRQDHVLLQAADILATVEL